LPKRRDGERSKHQEAAEHFAIASTMYLGMDMTFWLKEVEGRLSASLHVQQHLANKEG
jgi:hypothetical protein